MLSKIKFFLKRYWFLAACLFIFAFFRLINLNIIPVFADEAIYIRWAQLAWHDHTKRFIALTDGKPPLHTWLMIPFLKAIKDPLIAGRMLSAAAGFFTLAGIFLIIKKIFDDKRAFLSSFLVAVCPFLVFYDRLAVADSLLTAFGVWSFYLGLLLIEKPDLGRAFLLGFCWGGGLLTKQPALYFIILLPTLFLLKKPQKFDKLPFFIGLSLLIAVFSYNVIKLSPFSHLISVRSYDYVLGKREFLKDPFQLFWGNLKAIFVWVASYQTILGILLFCVGLVFMLKKESKKAVIFLAWLLLPIFGSAAIGKIIFPRYFVFIQPWIIVFIAYGLVSLVEKVKKEKWLNVKWLIVNCLLSLVFIAFWILFSYKIVFEPIKAPLIEREQDQYLTSWSAGYGLKKIAFYLKENFGKENEVYIATEGYFGTLPDGLQIYLDGFGNIEVFGIGQPIGTIPEDLLEKASMRPTFLVVNDSRFLADRIHLDLVAEYPKPEFPFLQESLLFFKVKSQ